MPSARSAAKSACSRASTAARSFPWRNPGAGARHAGPARRSRRTWTPTPAARTTKRFILHYNFPPFSVGETGRFGGQNRREIGHGALAERSRGAGHARARRTSRMPSASPAKSWSPTAPPRWRRSAAGVMALLDAGVPLKRPVAGISVGLVTEFDGNGKMRRYTTMLDIIGSEDHFGDMDFKLCGTGEGVTGFQLDLKLPGHPAEHSRGGDSPSTRRPHAHPRRR